MPSVSRRGFIKWTSVGLAASGVLGAVAPVSALAAGSPTAAGATSPGSQSGPAPMPGPMSAPVPAMPLLGGEPFVVYVSDPSTGAGSILVGERSIPFTNGAIVQSLRQAIG